MISYLERYPIRDTNSVLIYVLVHYCNIIYLFIDVYMLRQMSSLYAKSNKFIRTFSHCSIDVKITLFLSYCTAMYCPFLWTNYKKIKIYKDSCRI